MKLVLEVVGPSGLGSRVRRLNQSNRPWNFRRGCSPTYGSAAKTPVDGAKRAVCDIRQISRHNPTRGLQQGAIGSPHASGGTGICPGTIGGQERWRSKARILTRAVPMTASGNASRPSSLSRKPHDWLGHQDAALIGITRLDSVQRLSKFQC
jgi:hypothetical protein